MAIPDVDVHLWDGAAWVDITADVDATIGVQTTLGRADAFGPIPAGTAALTLRNQDRKYDPGNASSPLFGATIPNALIRIQVDISAADYVIMVGRVRSWVQEYAEPQLTVPLVLTDPLEDLGNITLKSPWEERALLIGAGTAPAAWYRLAETSGGVMVNSAGAAADGIHYEAIGHILGAPQVVVNGRGIAGRTTTGLIQYDSAAALAPGGDPSETVGPNNMVYVGYCDRNIFASQANWAVEFWFKTPSVTNDAGGGMIWSYWVDDNRRMRAFVNGANGHVTMQITNGTTSSWITKQSLAPVDDDKIHHACFRYTGTALELILDGTSEGTQATTAWTPPSSGAGNSSAHRIGWDVYNDTTPATFNGVIQDLMLWNNNVASAAMATNVGLRYDLGVGLWNKGQTVAVSANEFRDDIVDQYELSTLSATGTATVGPDAFEGLTALDWYRKLAATNDNGRFYKDPAAGFALTDNAPTWVSGTHILVSDDAAVDEIRFERPITVVFDYDYLRNVVEVGHGDSGGGTVSDLDATSITAHGARAYSVNSWYEDIADARSRASAELTAFKDPTLRVESMTVKTALIDAADQIDFVTAELGDPIKIRTRPGDAGPISEYISRIEGIDHSITREDWTTTFHMSPDSAPATSGTTEHFGQGTSLIQIDGTGTGTAMMGAGEGTSLLVTVLEVSSGPYVPGDRIRYLCRIKNTGSVTATAVGITSTTTINAWHDPDNLITGSTISIDAGVTYGFSYWDFPTTSGLWTQGITADGSNTSPSNGSLGVTVKGVGQTIYVDPSGNDGNTGTSPGAPKATVGAACTAITTGTDNSRSVIRLSGTFTSGDNPNIIAKNYVHVTRWLPADGGTDPIIKPNTAAADIHGLNFNECLNCAVDGIELDGTDASFVDTNGLEFNLRSGDVVVRNCVSHDWGLTGFLTNVDGHGGADDAGCDGFVWEDLHAYDNGVTSSLGGSGISMFLLTDQFTHTYNGNRMSRCYLESNRAPNVTDGSGIIFDNVGAGSGTGAASDGYSGELIIECCVMEDNYSQGINWLNLFGDCTAITRYNSTYRNASDPGLTRCNLSAFYGASPPDADNHTVTHHTYGNIFGEDLENGGEGWFDGSHGGQVTIVHNWTRNGRHDGAFTRTWSFTDATDKTDSPGYVLTGTGYDRFRLGAGSAYRAPSSNPGNIPLVGIDGAMFDQTDPNWGAVQQDA